MKWSRIKSKFESLLAECFRGKLRVHVTEYSGPSSTVGRGWISVDGCEVISVQIPSCFTRHIQFETSDLDFGEAIGTYINLPFAEAIASPDPITRGLSFLDRRFGKRSLENVREDKLHFFAKYTYRLRCAAEGIAPKRDLGSKVIN